MALTILPRPEQQPTALETLSGNFSSGLQALLNTKMQGMQQQQMANGLQALGIPGQLAMLPPELLQHIVPQYMKVQADQQNMTGYNQGASNLESLFSGGMQAPIAPVSSQRTQPVQNQSLSTQDIDEAIADNKLPGQQKESLQPPKRLNVGTFNSWLAQQRANGVKINPKDEKSLRSQYNEQKKQAEDQYKTDLSDYREQKKMQETERHHIVTEEAKGVERGAKTFDEMLAEAKVEDIKHLNYESMYSLAKKGNLATGVGPEALKKLGWEALLNPDTQQYNALMNNLVLELAKDMKGNLSDKDVKFLQAALPNIMMTPQGIAKGLRILMLTSKSKQLPYQYADKVTNSGERTIKNIGAVSYKQTAQDRRAYGQLAVKLARGEKIPMRDLPDGTTEMKMNNKWLQL